MVCLHRHLLEANSLHKHYLGPIGSLTIEGHNTVIQTTLPQSRLIQQCNPNAVFHRCLVSTISMHINKYLAELSCVNFLAFLLIV